MADLFKIIIAIIFPPVGVLLTCGLGKQLLINIVLCLLGYLPGIVHAVYLVGRNHKNIPTIKTG